MGELHQILPSRDLFVKDAHLAGYCYCYYSYLVMLNGATSSTSFGYDDSFTVLWASCENVENWMLVWNQCALAFTLHINWRKFSLISCTKRDLQCLGWHGFVVRKGSIFQYLRYLLVMNATNGQLIEWMSSKLRDKFMYWKSQSWAFHICLKVVQCIM